MSQEIIERVFELKKPEGGIPFGHPDKPGMRDWGIEFRKMVLGIHQECVNLGLKMTKSSNGEGTVSVQGDADTLHQLGKFIVMEKKFHQPCDQVELVVLASLTALEEVFTQGKEESSEAYKHRVQQTIAKFLQHFHTCTHYTFLRDDILRNAEIFHIAATHDPRVFPDVTPVPLQSSSASETHPA